MKIIAVMAVGSIILAISLGLETTACWRDEEAGSQESVACLHSELACHPRMWWKILSPTTVRINLVKGEIILTFVLGFRQQNVLE